MIVIARFVEGVSLNGYEFVLNQDDSVMRFTSPEEAMNYLTEQTGVAYPDTFGWEENEGIFFLTENELYED